MTWLRQQEKTWRENNGKKGKQTETEWNTWYDFTLEWQLTHTWKQGEGKECNQEREGDKVKGKQCNWLLTMWHHRKNTLTNTLRTCIHYRETESSRKRERSMTTRMSVRQCATRSSDGQSRVKWAGEEYTIVRRRGEKGIQEPEKGWNGKGKCR